jgi:hypothetical protein
VAPPCWSSVARIPRVGGGDNEVLIQIPYGALDV